MAALQSALQVMPGIDACVLYGSYARRAATQGSDLDVLLIADDPTVGIRFIERLFTKSSETARIASVATLLPSDLAHETVTRPSFIAHLRDEGTFMEGARKNASEARTVISRTQASKAATDREVDCRVARVMRTLRSDRFNGSYGTALARVYLAAKAVCIARLLGVGAPEYDWRLVFDSFSAEWPRLRAEVALLKELRPQYEQLRGTHRCSRAEVADSEADFTLAVDCLNEVVLGSR